LPFRAFWEKLHSQVAVALTEGVTLQRWLYRLPVSAGRRLAIAAEGGRSGSPVDRLMFALGDRLVLHNLKRMMGLSRAHSLLTGAAPISPDLIRWYRSIGLSMQEAYGQTESTCFLTVTPKDGVRPGTVGKPIPGCEIRLSNERRSARPGTEHFSGVPEQSGKDGRGCQGWLAAYGRRSGNSMKTACCASSID